MADILLLKTLYAVKSWLSTIFKNILLLAITYKIAEWVYLLIYDFIDKIANLFKPLLAQGSLIFAVVCGLGIVLIYFLGRYPLTQFWIFKLKRAAEKHSYFAIKCPAEGGGWMYGFVNHSYVNRDTRLYDAVVCWGGYSRKFGMTEHNFRRLNMTIPEVIMLAYIAPWIPFMTKILPQDESGDGDDQANK